MAYSPFNPHNDYEYVYPTVDVMDSSTLRRDSRDYEHPELEPYAPPPSVSPQGVNPISAFTEGLALDGDPIVLGWDDLNYFVTVGKGKKKKRRQILTNVTGMAPPGQMLAIMGPSGAGKTSLLNALAGRLPSSGDGELMGRITVNGRLRDNSFRQLVGYVMQDDVFFSNLTVTETLTLAARLRLPREYSKAQKKEIVDQVIAELSLNQARDTKIGGPAVAGISGGERKRVNIGTELITRVPILFLDEPTSNLDAFQALNVMNSLRGVASGGRAVVCTIHQPRSSIYALFDKLLLLSEGRIMYYGNAADAVIYFSKLGYDCPKHFNPADYFLDVIAVDRKTPETTAECEARLETLANAYDVSGHRELMENELTRLEQGPPANIDHKKKFATGWGTQFMLLAQRAFRQLLRDKFALVITIFVQLFFGLLLGCIYWQMGLDQKSIQGRTGLCFFVCIQMTFSSIGSVQNTFPNEQRVITRERQARMYRVSPYYIAKLVAELLLKFWSPLLYGTIIYWMAGLNPGFDHFVFFCFVLELMNLVGTALGLFISALAPNVTVAGILAPLIIVLFMLGGGFYQNLDKLPVFISWLQYISFIRYAFEALTINEFRDLTFTCDASDGGNCITTGVEALSRLSLGTTAAIMWRDVGILFGFIFGFHALAYLLVRFKASGSFENG
jgi:ABC-type multidrug transport system ATPase subunit/ABC-type multidrug transport system permease subunit